MCMSFVSKVLTVSIYTVFKAPSLSFLKLFQIENWLNIKEIMTMYTVFCKFHKNKCLDVNFVDKQHSIHNTQ